MKCNTGLKWVKPVNLTITQRKQGKQDVKWLKIWNKNAVWRMKSTTKSQNLYIVNNHMNIDSSKENGNMRSLTW